MTLDPTGYAFNRTRQVYLATRMRVADSHWSRLVGLTLTPPAEFGQGKALWIVPSRGVHTLAMRFPIDVLYLDENKRVVYIGEGLKPWRVAPVRLGAVSVLELPQSTLARTGTALGDEIELAVGQPREAITA